MACKGWCERYKIKGKQTSAKLGLYVYDGTKMRCGTCTVFLPYNGHNIKCMCCGQSCRFTPLRWGSRREDTRIRIA